MRSVWQGWLAAVLLLVVLAVGAPTARAHTGLTVADPAADSTVATGPNRVSATFNEPLQPTFAAMTVVGPDGHLWSAGDTEVRDATASVAVRPLGPAGRYTVNYRVTSADGHVVTGSWSFTLADAGTGKPGPAVDAPAAAPASAGDRIPLWPFAVGAVALVAAAAIWAMRRQRG